MTVDIDTPDGWIKAEPEQFEDRLFVTKQTFEDIDVAVAHIAYYEQDGIVEFCKAGSYDFTDVSCESEAVETINQFMVQWSGESTTLLHYYS